MTLLLARGVALGVAATTGFNSTEDGSPYATGNIHGQGSALGDWAGAWAATISASDPAFVYQVAAGGSEGGAGDQSLAMAGSLSGAHVLRRGMDAWSGDFEWTFDVRLGTAIPTATCQQQLEGGVGGAGTTRPLNLKWELDGTFKVNDLVMMNYMTPSAGYVSMRTNWVGVKVVCDWEAATFDLYWEKTDGSLGLVGTKTGWKDAGWATHMQVGTFRIDAPKQADMWVDNIRLVVPGAGPTPEITGLSQSNQVLTIAFTGGELQRAPVVMGPWAGTGNSSGVHVEPIAGGTKKFYRVSNQLSPGPASNPDPANGALNVSTAAALSWTAGSGATSHDVYFGTSNPPGFMGNQAGTTYSPGALLASTTYYWRVDEENEAGTTTGTVWSFTTGTNATLTITGLSPATNTVQYNSLAVGQPIYMDRAYTFTDVGTLGGSTYIRTANNDKSITGNSYMTFNVNQSVVVYVAHDNGISPKPEWLSSFVETGQQLVTTDKSLGLFAREFPAGTVTLGGNSGGTLNSMYSVVITVAPTSPPAQASNPNPANGATNVATSTSLSWTAGAGAYSHEVYFGTSNPLGFQGNQTGKTYSPGALSGNTLYYWRIDEKNSAGTTTGTVWSFTTGSAPVTGDIVFPGATWHTKTPAELGLDGTKIDQFAANIGGVGCIIRQGYLVKTWGAANSKDYWASATKPVISTLLLYAVKEGLLTNVHEKIRDHGYNLSAKDQPMEFYHLANMTGGYARGESPGAAWAYNDYAIRLYANTLFTNVFGTGANAAALNPNRLGALGFEDGAIFQTRTISGVNYGEHLYTSPRDFARIGWFWCNQGFWSGTQLLPKQYFDDYMKVLVPAGTPRTTSAGSDYLGIGTYGGGSDQTAYGPGLYGFNWWFNPNQSHWPDVPADAFQANGHWGQEVMTVIPSLSLVVAYRRGPVDSTWFQPGSASSPMNQNLRLLVEACPPVPSIRTGSLMRDPEHPAWLKRYNGNSLFLCGPGDPEDFLYRGTRNADGTRNGDQLTLINKLKGTGANCIYLQAVKSHGGDGDSTMNPFVNSDVSGLLDEDILNQWEMWFTEMDNNGMVIFFMFYDDASSPFGSDLAGGQLPAQEAYMIDAIVNRFEHHRNLIWIVSEEYQKALTAARVSKIAERIKLADDYDHPVGTHQLPGTAFNFNSDPNMDQFAMQLNDATTAYVHNSCVAAWSNVGGLKNVNLAEIYEFNTIPQTGAALRQKAWAAAMGGAYSMWLWMDIASTPVSDLQTCGRLVNFMEATKFYQTRPYDSLARGSTSYVLADPGNVYIAYGVSGTTLGVNVLGGTYRVKWFDTIDGDWSDQGSQTLAAGDRTFTKPADIGAEAALYLEAQVQAAVLLPNDDCTTLNGVNKNNDPGGEMGLFVKYAGYYSWIEFTLGSVPANQAILTLYQDDGNVQSPWEIVVRGAEYNFNETTFTGTDYSAWTRVGTIPNVAAIGPVTLDLSSFYNNNLGKTITLQLYRDQQPAGNINGPIFQDKELTRRFWWSADEGPKISIN